MLLEVMIVKATPRRALAIAMALMLCLSAALTPTVLAESPWDDLVAKQLIVSRVKGNTYSQDFRLTFYISAFDVSEKFPVTITIGTASASSDCYGSGDLWISIPAVQLNALALGEHRIMISSPGNTVVPPCASMQMGTLTMTGASPTANPTAAPTATPSPTAAPTPTPANWTMPATFTARLGVLYQLAEPTMPGQSLPLLSVKSSNSAVAAANGYGQIRGKKTGTATITMRSPDGAKRTCKVTVKGNGISHGVCLPGPADSVWSSAKKLSYDGKYLRVQAFCVNKTAKTILKAPGLQLELWKKGEAAPFYTAALRTRSYPKGFKPEKTLIFEFSIAKSKIPRFASAIPDLTADEYEACVVGWDGAKTKGMVMDVLDAEWIAGS